VEDELPEKIVVACDGGPASRAALDWVIDRALRTPSEVEVVTVEETDWLPLGADESLYRPAYGAVLSDAETHLANRHGISFVTTTLLSGKPAEELADASVFADALVIGSPRVSATVGALHGTLALRLATQTSCHLVVVPADWKPGSGPIVVGAGDDEARDGAVEDAADEAHRTGRDLLVVHAWSLPAPFSVLDALLKTTYPTLEAIHERILDAAVARARARSPLGEIFKLLRFGRPAEVLATVALNATGLFVQSHQRGVVGELMLGSVSHDVIMSAPCPITVVPRRAEPRSDGRN
jgi:nucleotide-binding universal stress UspA family protein